VAEPSGARGGGRIEDFPARPKPPLPIAISQCLLGAEVRYDGSDAACAYPHAALSNLFEYRGICPEVGIGMSVPRAPIRLVGDPASPRVVGVDDPAVEVTDALRDYGRHQAAGFDDVAGHVFMKSSPSCGLFRVKVYPHDHGRVAGAPVLRGRGAYAAAVVEACPNLPVEENGRLHDPVLRESFVIRAFAYAHWKALERAGLSRARLVEFHSRYKYLLMAHSVAHYQQTGTLLADLKRDFEDKAERYLALLMAGLARPATRRGHANVLSHLQAPITLLEQHLRNHPDAYLQHQVYFDPHPGYDGLRRPL
jgi:uncharacterized protein YbgA (DUF1722 family)/uncharacterized protein YbbK (DUF523 family)